MQTSVLSSVVAGFEAKPIKNLKSSFGGLKSSRLVSPFHLRFSNPGRASSGGPRQFPHHYCPYGGESGGTALANSCGRVVRDTCARKFHQSVGAGRRFHGYVCSFGPEAGVADGSFGLGLGRNQSRVQNGQRVCSAPVGRAGRNGMGNRKRRGLGLASEGALHGGSTIVL